VVLGHCHDDHTPRSIWCHTEQRGHIVTVTNPLTGKKVTGSTLWVSPSGKTVQVRLADGTTVYTFPREED